MINDLYTYITIPSVFLKMDVCLTVEQLKVKVHFHKQQKKKKKGVEGLGVKALAESHVC